MKTGYRNSAGKLMTWLIMHVAGMDQKIGEYVKSKGGQIQ